jgi:uncharacterized protein (DUF488 family)
MNKEKAIYTIGTSNRSLQEFLEILKKYSIQQIADVRRFPTSRYEHFKQENLKNSLEKEGIKYVHIKELGGYRKNGYLKHIQSDEFKQGIEKLLEITRYHKTAVMCAELLFFRCHRRFISDKLVEQGEKVIHIIDEKRTYQHRYKGEQLP